MGENGHVVLRPTCFLVGITGDPDRRHLDVGYTLEASVEVGVLSARIAWDIRLGPLLPWSGVAHRGLKIEECFVLVPLNRTHASELPVSVRPPCFVEPIFGGPRQCGVEDFGGFLPIRNMQTDVVGPYVAALFGPSEEVGCECRN